MRTVHKFPLEVTEIQEVKLPANYDLLHVGMQGNTPTLWAEVVTENRMTTINIAVYGTGHPQCDNPKDYIGTVFQGPFVWHIYHIF